MFADHRPFRVCTVAHRLDALRSTIVATRYYYSTSNARGLTLSTRIRYKAGPKKLKARSRKSWARSWVTRTSK